GCCSRGNRKPAARSAVAVAIPSPRSVSRGHSIHYMSRGSFGCERLPFEGKPEPLPDIDECFGEGVHERVVVIGRRSNPQPLRSARHSGVIDRLAVDPLPAQEQTARSLAFLGAPDKKGHDMRVARLTARPAILSTSFTRAALS